VAKKPTQPLIERIQEGLSCGIQKHGQGMKVRTDVQFVPKLKMGGAIPQSLHMSSWHVKGRLYLSFILTVSLYSSAHCVS